MPGNKNDDTANSDGLVVLDKPEKTTYDLDAVINRVIQGDSREVLKKIPDQIADLVFFDPPYNLQLPKKRLTRWKVNSTVNGVTDLWDQFGSFSEYDEFLSCLLIEIRRIMKPGATFWGISTYHNLFRMGKMMQDLGFWILNDMIWIKTNPMPNWLGVRFTNATETLIWALRSREARGYTFHPQLARKFGIGRIGANVWVIPTCTGKERIRGENGQKIHSTQKPVELLKRILLTSTNEGDLVLDPLAGVGTTGFTASTLGRKFVMVEANPDYVQAIRKRLDQLDSFRDRDETNEQQVLLRSFQLGKKPKRGTA